MLSLRTPIGLGAALSASLAASFLGASPAQAQAQAPSGGFPGGIEGTAVVADCGRRQVDASKIFDTAVPFACQKGDKIYSNFTLITDTDFNLLDSGFLFQDVGTNHTLAAFGNFVPGTYEFGYTVTVFDAINSGNSLQSIRNDALNSAIGAGVPSWVKTLSAFSTGGDIDTKASRTGLVQTDDGPVSFPAAVKPTSADFISKLVVAIVPGQNNFTPGFSDTVTQLEPSDTVPGPLPILGAAAAFGFSRKLRSRIKQTV